MCSMFRYSPRSFSFLIIPIILAIGCNRPPTEIQAYFRFIENPAGEGARYPHLHHADDGRVYISWLRQVGQGRFALEYSRFDGDGWSAPETIYSGDDFFVNWADYPSITSFPDGTLAAHWLRKVEGGTFAYHVQIAFRDHNGQWSVPVTPHLDLSPTEHGFASLKPLANGRLLAVWLDGRHTGGHEGHSGANGHHSGPMTLRSAEIAPDGSIHRKNEIDALVCDCCQTALAGDDNQVYVFYRDRNEDEVRDISFARYDTGSGTWSVPENLWNDNWVIGGCPVNGPRAAVDGNRLAVAWFSGADEDYRVLVSQKVLSDGGFSTPLRLDIHEPLGRVAVAFDEKGTAWISWIEVIGDGAFVYVRGFGKDGGTGAPIRVAEIHKSRASGFPVMAAKDGRLLMAWTQHEPHFEIISILVDVY